MKSLRTSLLVGTGLATTAVLLASGVVLHALIRNALWAEFDASLAAKARSLAALAEEDEDGLEFELTELSLPEFAPSDQAEYYELWWPAGTVFIRSPSLYDRDLAPPPRTSATPAFENIKLPDGRPGRTVGLTFAPRQERAGSATSPPRTATLVLARSVAGLQTSLSRVRAILVSVCFAAVALSAGVLAGVVRRSLKPLDRLGAQIANLGADRLSARLDPAGAPDEMLPVVQRLNDLLSRLETAFQRERRFTGDVAHELRTPLAGLRSKLEVALSRPRDPAAYQAAMAVCLDINLHMQRMVENLLHLARVDAGQLELRCESVAVSDLIGECWAPLAEQADSRRLGVEWELNAPQPLATDRDQLRLVLRNVLENAVVHADKGGHVRVVASAAGPELVVTVRNTGWRLAPDEASYVFDRFWRGDASHGELTAGHCGLGLSLCKAVVERLGGHIEASASGEGAFTVTIHLPPAGRSNRPP